MNIILNYHKHIKMMYYIYVNVFHNNTSAGFFFSVSQVFFFLSHGINKFHFRFTCGIRPELTVTYGFELCMLKDAVTLIPVVQQVCTR